MRVIKRRISSFAPTRSAKIAKTCYHSQLLSSFFFGVPSNSRAHAHVHWYKWSEFRVRVPLIRLRPIRASSKKVIIFIRTGKCLTKRVVCYYSDGSRSDCCFVSLTRNVCQVSGFRFSDRPVWRCVIISNC